MDIEMTPSQEFWFSAEMLLRRLLLPGIAVLFVVLLVVVIRQLRNRRK
jgi:hypothetical protein